MIFKTRPGIEKKFQTEHDFGYENLIVSGCSFSYNQSDNHLISWPYYLRDLGGFSCVLDCALPGAGNQHIANSLQWALEIEKPDPAKSLVIVMWSGNDRDDYICPKSNIDTTYNFQFNYNNNVMSGITGGGLNSSGNTINGLKQWAKTKSLESKAIENYLHISGLWHFLKNSNYKFVFLNFLNNNLPSRSLHFDIGNYLPPGIQKNLNLMIERITDPYEWALKNNFLSEDDFHPNINGYLTWTRSVLLPHLKTLSI
jgi:hypothetical protein